MMQKPEETIELVKKWLADPESVSQEELEANYRTAWAAWVADARVDDAASAAVRAAASAAADWADGAAWAEYWVELYEELTK